MAAASSPASLDGGNAPLLGASTDPLTPGPVNLIPGSPHPPISPVDSLEPLRRSLPPSPTEMTFPVGRPSSSGGLPIRFASNGDGPYWDSSHAVLSARLHKSVVQLKPSNKCNDKEAVREDISFDTSCASEQSWILTNRDQQSTPSSTPTPPDHSQPPAADRAHHNNTKKRGSLLVAASDVISSKFGRRRPSIRQPLLPVVLPEVLEISAPRIDEEMEERNRLREQAAQAIGLGPFMVQHDPKSYQHTVEDEGEESGHDEVTHPAPPAAQRLVDLRDSSTSPNRSGRSLQSLAAPSATVIPPSPGRFRSGSVLSYSHWKVDSASPDIPSFPTNLFSLNPFRQTAAPLPKYYPPSMRLFNLTRNWKTRYVVLTSPAQLVNRQSGPAVSFLHLFKAATQDDKELERLEINEDSVVFVADEEVGGKRHVISVGGMDAGVSKKDATSRERERIVWFLQITDPAEAQKWIANIKNVILGQRTLRAGLGLPSSLGNTEPRGDMDVMFSIRAQGLVPPSTTLSNIGLHPVYKVENSYAPSLSSLSAQSRAPTPKPPSSGPVSTLKGLFSTTSRPRSPSRATSVDQDRHNLEPVEESFTSLDGNLLSMMHSSAPDPPLSNSRHNSSTAMPGRPILHSQMQYLDRKIVLEPLPQRVTNNPLTAIRTSRAMSLDTLSLQPPPRKRWTSIGMGNANNTGDGLLFKVDCTTTGVHKTKAISEQPFSEPASPSNLAAFMFGTPEQRPRAPSLVSVSTLTSGENSMATDRTSSTTVKHGLSRRWSRPGTRISTLSGSEAHPPVHMCAHPYAADHSLVRTSSTDSMTSQHSIVSSLPDFSKRASSTPAFSINTPNTSPSMSPAILSVHHSPSKRNSLPPPQRPAPTSALPLPPVQDLVFPSDSAFSSTKSTFRQSVAQRSFRLSMVSPKPPPTTVLPLRPDDPQLLSRRRASYDDTGAQSHLQGPIHPTSPFPPPILPLPPTPVSLPTSVHFDALKKGESSETSLRRLRILSDPSNNTSASSLPAPIPSAARPKLTISPPVTHFAEKITLFQYDPSFLMINTPSITSSSSPQSMSSPSEDFGELISLSPPPRRGSRHVSPLESEIESPILPVSPQEKDRPYDDGETRILSLSRPGSVVSLGLVNV